MAEPIDYAHPPRHEKQEFYHDLHGRSGERAEGALDANAILQLLRDKGVLELIKDALGSMEKVMEVITEMLERDEVVRTVRNVTTLVKMLGSIEPDTLENIVKSLSNTTEGSTAKKPPGLLHLLSQLTSSDTRRALEPIAAVLQAAGRSITQAPKEEAAHTTRHGA
jgi:uncharacterized protein YjgD (DUF1641 family)